MRIISLNTWGGRAGKDELLSFLKANVDTTDIFCLQEVWSESNKHLEDYSHAEGKHRIMVYGLQDISAVMPNHKAFYRPNRLDKFGLLMMVQKKYDVADEGEFPVYERKGDTADGDVGSHTRKMQYATIKIRSRLLTIGNFHGLWNGRGKADCPERLEQSEKILNFTKKVHNPIIIIGDFVLLPDTASVKTLEDAGLRNLIKEYEITSTRTSFYSKPEKFSDYAFVSKDVKVKDFKVLPDEVSDHAPLSLEIR